MLLLVLQDHIDGNVTPLASAVLFQMNAEQRFLKAFIASEPIPMATILQLGDAAAATSTAAYATVSGEEV